jgi:rare lipoprotein A (peptidoglycan hydrolase)
MKTWMSFFLITLICVGAEYSRAADEVSPKAKTAAARKPAATSNEVHSDLQSKNNNGSDRENDLESLYKLHGVKWDMIANTGPSKKYPNQSGEASYYTRPQKTASGDYFDPSELTAAHKKLPFGTLVKCSCKETGKSVVVMVNDRGPYAEGRVIDLSTAAAKKLGIAGRKGTTPISIEILAYPQDKVSAPKDDAETTSKTESTKKE